MNTRPIIVAGSAARIFTGWGPKPVADKPDGLGQIMERFDAHHTETKSLLGANKAALDDLKSKHTEVDARLMDLEQKGARRGGPVGGGERKTLGELVVENPDVKARLAAGSGYRGKTQISLDRKTILSASGTWGTGVSPTNSLTLPDRQPIVELPKRRLVMRDLFVPAQTLSNAIEYPKQTGFTNNAAPVAEGVAKPYSNLTFDLAQAPVRTIAHMMKASRQILDDAPALQGFINSQLQYGLSITEEQQVLYGDGSGQNLLGIVPQASTYSSPFGTITGETAIDRLLAAIAQIEVSLYEPNGIVINSLDWRKLQLLKDATGRYLSGDPFDARRISALWQLPLVPTPALTAGTFLVGDFQTGAQIFERMSVEILISTENADDFEKNLVSVRCEERIALPVYRPPSFVTGSMP